LRWNAATLRGRAYEPLLKLRGRRHSKSSYSRADPTRPKLPALCRGHAYFCVPKLSGFTKLAHFLSARLRTFSCYCCATTFSATISNSTKKFENSLCWIYETERHDLRDLSERPWEAAAFAVAAVGPRCAVPAVKAIIFFAGFATASTTTYIWMN